MKIRAKAILAGPDGVTLPGEVHECSRTAGEALILAGAGEKMYQRPAPKPVADEDKSDAGDGEMEKTSNEPPENTEGRPANRQPRTSGKKR